MSETRSSPAVAEPAPSGPLLGDGLTPGKTAIFAGACGAMVANLYYAQPLIGVIAPDLRLSPSIAGLIVTLTQFGYGIGLLFLVSLADLVENRRLVFLTTAGVVLGLIAAATSRSAAVFLFASFFVGFCSVGAQVIVPLATYMTRSRTRGRAIGNIMSGLLAGIMLARPLASAVDAAFGWRAIFWLSAGVMLVMAVFLAFALPRRQPETGASYAGILRSTLGLLRQSRTLRRRSIYQGILFATFNIFWTAGPLMLRDSFGLTQRGIALFALAGAGGALSAPIAGRLADKGWTRAGTALAIGCSAASFLVTRWSVEIGSLAILVIAAIVLDAATQANHVISQRIIYDLAPNARGRINAAYMTAMFMFGAFGSVAGGFIYAHAGWSAAAWTGAGLGAAALAFFLTERGTGRA